MNMLIQFSTTRGEVIINMHYVILMQAHMDGGTYLVLTNNLTEVVPDSVDDIMSKMQEMVDAARK